MLSSNARTDGFRDHPRLDIIYAARRGHWQLESNATHRRARGANYVCDNMRNQNTGVRFRRHRLLRRQPEKLIEQRVITVANNHVETSRVSRAIAYHVFRLKSMVRTRNISSVTVVISVRHVFHDASLGNLFVKRFNV